MHLLGLTFRFQFSSENTILSAAFRVKLESAMRVPLDVMYTNAPYKVIQRAMHIHPTISELIPMIAPAVESTCVTAARVHEREQHQDEIERVHR